ncbi:hypothetical protein [Pedobacter sp. NJ-S-72]
MGKQTLNTIKNWFKTGLKPTQSQFSDTWDSFFHKDDVIPSSSIENLDLRFNQKADDDAFKGHLVDINAHRSLFDQKADIVHRHEISDVSQLAETLSGKQDILKEGAGIKISADNTISVTVSTQVAYASFQIFKAQGNTGDVLQVNDWVRGFIEPGKMITGKYNGGNVSAPTSYTVIEQIEFN